MSCQVGQWHPADQYDGQVREITFRSVCNNPLCPPDTAMTEWQHVVLSPDKKRLVFETVQQAHDVPFGSSVEERAESALRARSSSVKGSQGQAKIPEDNVSKMEKLQAFIKEEVLVGIYNDVFPCTAEQFFSLLLNDDSRFLNEYRSERKDTNLNVGQWHPADQYDGQVHCRWCFETNAENSCTIDIKVGAHFKKWCIMQSKIKAGAINEYKKEVDLMLEVARSYIKSHTSRPDGEITEPTASSSVTEDCN
ncbi:hypothetical protein JRO89_XS03G0032500 [Xanthoceras sorbifolium]|uniref:VASt domain-containing protein n=1 Tax=Xanthoceras sorbifolium TaxID=99658 RepID=A0ABQ8I8E9_9ROSI|nr:hypothetical protein JRO89_XS03G0032500 [Xanthoceras sorbifolium]